MNNEKMNNLGQGPRICTLRSTRDVATSDQLENRVDFPGFSIARFSLVAIMSGPWTSPLVDAALASRSTWRAGDLVQARVRGRDVAG